MKKAIPFQILPGSRASDITPSELPQAIHQEVQNFYINKKGEWKKLPHIKSLTPTELVYKSSGTTTASIGQIKAAVEYEDWLIVFTSLGKFFRVQIDSNGNYINGPFDLSGTKYCSEIKIPSGETALTGTETVQFIIYNNAIRVFIKERKSYYILAAYEKKTIYGYDGTALGSYGDDSFINTSQDEVTMWKRELNLSTDTIETYVRSDGPGYFIDEEYDTSSDKVRYFFSAFIAFTFVSESGQMYPPKYFKAKVRIAGSSSTYHEFDGVVYFALQIEVSDTTNLRLGIDITIADLSKIPGDAVSMAVFLATDPQELSVSGEGGSKISLLDPNYSWRFIDTILIDNKETYSDEISTFPYDYYLNMSDAKHLSWPYQGEYPTAGDDIGLSSAAAKLPTSIAPGSIVKVVTRDTVGNEYFSTGVCNSILRYTHSSPNYVYLDVAFNADMTNIYDSSANRTKGSSGELLVYNTWRSDGASGIKRHISINLMQLATKDNILNVYRYNVFAKDFYPDITKLAIANFQAYAITDKYEERGFMRYSAKNDIDILPEDNVIDVGSADVMDIIQRRNAVALLTPRGIIQGSLQNNSFYRDIEFTRKGGYKEGGYIVLDGVIYFLGDDDLYRNDGNTTTPVFERGANRLYYAENINSNTQLYYNSFLDAIEVYFDSNNILLLMLKTGDIFRKNLSSGAIAFTFLTQKSETRLIYSSDTAIYKTDDSSISNDPMLITSAMIDNIDGGQTKRLDEVRLYLKGSGATELKYIKIEFKDIEDGRTKGYVIDSLPNAWKFYRFRPRFLYRQLEIKIYGVQASAVHLEIQKLEGEISAW
jgi:hypothetical protein